jgi:multimeric flavodoxin WrbA
MVAQVVKENEAGFLPPLKTKVDSMDEYDVVFVGFPTRDMQMPPPIKSFLKNYDLRGKTVIPFNTNAGYGVGSGFGTVEYKRGHRQPEEPISVGHPDGVAGKRVEGRQHRLQQDKR